MYNLEYLIKYWINMKNKHIFKKAETYVIFFTLVYMQYFDYLVYMGERGKKASWSNSGIWLPTIVKLGMIILWATNFSNLAK